MASNDAITKADIEGLKVYIDGRISDIEARISGLEQAISEVKKDLCINAVKLDAINDTVSWNFITLAIVIIIAGFTVTLAPMLHEIFRDKRKQERDEIRRIVRDEIANMKANPQ